jgi:GT2 family glycosyltransferase
MKLSVIIVNYNVEHFLEQCLSSVRKASQGIPTEVFVVDNNSVDGSVEMVKKKFPDVILIANKSNVGFAKANNQAIKQASGQYVLLLNPDTVVEDDTFVKVIRFMDEHPEAGGLGVKMLDGSGKFLPESKRGLPTPATAFYKIFGLSALFPRSKRFSKYHLGYLSEDEIHPVDVLAGAFMLVRKETLDKTGLLDEDFFMYGEDIDLSYRISLAGYTNYYFPKTRIIHYKGESTKKSSVNYVMVFYRAMVIFARKHFTQKSAGLFTFFINIAIYFRAFLAILSRIFKRLSLPVVDAVIMTGGVFLVKNFWENQFIYPDGGHYPQNFVQFVIPVYLLLWLISLYFSGAWDKPIRIIKVLQGVLTGTVLILLFYALFPENLRFSRAQILVDTVWGLLMLPLVRYLFSLTGWESFQVGEKQNKRFLVIGDQQEANRVAVILNDSYLKPEFIGLINSYENKPKPDGFIGNLNQVQDIITIYRIDEVIFCSKNVSHQSIIDMMAEWKSEKIDYKIAPEDSLSIIGSKSIHTQGELYTVDINSIDKPVNRRNKALFDVTTALLFLTLYPLEIFVVKRPFSFLINIFAVLFRRKTWVSYSPAIKGLHHLPPLKSGVLCPEDGLKQKEPPDEMIEKINLLYARDYSLLKDVNIIFHGFTYLGK